MKQSGGIASRIAAWWQDPLNRIIAVVLVIYAIAMGMHMQASGGGPDQSGYLNNARLLARGIIRADQPVIPGLDVTKIQPATLVPLGFRPVGIGQMIPTYSTGLPAAVLCVAGLTGWGAAPHVTMLAMAILGLLVTAWLGIEMGLPRPWAWFAAMLLAGSPVYIVMSLQLMSDVPALVFVTCAVALAWKSRGRDAWALLAGIVVACSVFVRPTDLLVMAPVSICLGFAWRRWLLFGLGGLPGAILWCLYNRAANGHFFETGYGEVTGLFDWRVIGATGSVYVPWLPMLVTPVGLFALGLPWLLRRSFVPALMLMAWVFAFLGFYLMDTGVNNWECLRYLLPSCPACIIGGLLVIQRLLQTAGGVRLASIAARSGGKGPALLMTAVIIYSVAWGFRLNLGRMTRFPAIYPAAVQWADLHIPPNAVVIGKLMTGTFYCYTPFTMVCTDFLNPKQWNDIVKVCAATHRPVYAAIFYPYDLPPLDEEQMDRKDWTTNVDEFLRTRFPGHWKQAGRVDTVMFWQLEMQ